MLAALDKDIVRVRRVGGGTPSRGVVSLGWGGGCAVPRKVGSSESALLPSAAVRLRLCRRSREGYGGGGSCGTFRGVSSDISVTGGCGDI